jgi:hypothetical protein
MISCTPLLFVELPITAADASTRFNMQALDFGCVVRDVQADIGALIVV